MVALAELAPPLAWVGPAPARGTTPQAASSGRAAPAAAIPAMNVRLVTMSFLAYADRQRMRANLHGSYARPALGKNWVRHSRRHDASCLAGASYGSEGRPDISHKGVPTGEVRLDA